MSPGAVLVIGASGTLGPSVVDALLGSSTHTVSVLTRESSKATFPAGVNVIRTDYTAESLRAAFAGIDIIVSCIALFSATQQTAIIDAAIQAGVKRFIPSDFSGDTSAPGMTEVMPMMADKVEVVHYLRSKQDTGMTWTSVIVGAFFDCSFAFPGFMGWDLPGRKAKIYDSGDTAFEASNLAQIGRAVAAVVSPEHIAETANRYVYVNSFTTTQNEVLQTLEKATGDKFEVTHISSEEANIQGQKDMEKKQFFEAGGAQYMVGSLEVIESAIYGYGGCNNFSKDRGLWNERLGLPTESVEETINRVVKG